MAIEGGCMCGAVRYRVEGGMLWTAHCHCRDCQRAAGADYVSWFGVLRDQVRWTGTRAFRKSSPPALRSFCPVCGTPLTYETEALPRETHLYAPGLDDPGLYRPAMHVMWSERVPWLVAGDRLPKYPRWRSDSAPLPEEAP